jgi:hypothetical protein
LEAVMFKQILLILVAVSASAASTPSCFFLKGNQTPTLMCSDFGVYVSPGSCTTLKNPCNDDGSWIVPRDFRSDAFAIVDRPATVWVDEQIASDSVERSLCAAPGAGDISGQSFVFVYERHNVVSGFGTGHVTLTVSSPIVITASAEPNRIQLHGTAQLVAAPSGGIPPYSYSWIPTSGLDRTNIPTPKASPSVDTVYEVSVTDSSGQTVKASVAVDVDFALVVTANPPAINPFDFSALGASGGGGRPPYTYSWSPSDTLDNPMIQSPVAQPRFHTTYTVVATDADGVRLTGSAEVRVNLLLMTLTATPATIFAGQSGAQLSATAAGGDGVYNYTWSPATGLDDPHSPHPIALPAVTTDYEVVVTDGQGQTAPGARGVIRVNVLPAPTLNAEFSFLRGALDPVARTVHWTFDASASAGAIASYAWHIARLDNSTVLDTVTTGPVLEVDLPESVVRGNTTLTVTAADGTTATTKAFR